MALVFHYRNLLIIDCSLHTDEEIHSRGLQEEIAGSKGNSPPQPDFAGYTHHRKEQYPRIEDYGLKVSIMQRSLRARSFGASVNRLVGHPFFSLIVRRLSVREM
jgi:hypothetical protein